MKNGLRYLACAVIAGGLVACSAGKNEANAPAAAAPSATAKPAAGTKAAPSATPSAAPAAAASPATSASASPGSSSIEQASAGTIGTSIEGEILKPDQKDFYHFDVTAKVRDLAVVRIQNKSSTLKPDFKTFDANRAQLSDTYDGTAGASVEKTITIEPGKSFYVAVSPAYNSTGKYTLSITPQKAYDAYEPNNDVLSAFPIAIGTPIAGSIMDDKDVRWFRMTGATKKTIHVVLDNQSTSLKPEVKIFSATKSQIMDKYDGTSGANLDFTVDIEPGKDFYLQVFPYGTAGKFKVTATEQ
ncbi:MAG TPA: hypothetical protein VK660_02770 [Xanthomonadaceae bacterium]|jgi:hypothetical protein|nr:hypothetical protein [Xanthomonadaceae bacterium]